MRKGTDMDRKRLEAENRELKTLVQEGRATKAQEIRLAQVRAVLADMVGTTWNDRWGQEHAVERTPADEGIAQAKRDAHSCEDC